jgi:hypothetical protein
MAKYLIEVEVDEDKLYDAVGGIRHQFVVSDGIVQEMGWAHDSGIYVNSVKEVESDVTGEYQEITGPWAFVEKYYPDYHRCDNIATEGDLCKLNEKEYEEGDCAHGLLMDWYNGDINHPDIFKDWKVYLCDIYEVAINAYIESIKDKKNG